MAVAHSYCYKLLVTNKAVQRLTACTRHGVIPRLHIFYTVDW